MNVNSIANIGIYSVLSGNQSQAASLNDPFGLKYNSNTVVAMAQIAMAKVQNQMIGLSGQVLAETARANMPLVYGPGQNSLIGLTLNAANQANQATLFNYLI